MNPNVTVIQPTITAKQKQKIRVAAYCRVSSDSADQLNSFMTQMRYYENFLADSKTETLISVYADEGITGTRMDKREEFQRMLKDCRRGKIDRIIAKSISRFARNTKECLTVLRELKSLGITVLFEKENIDTANISDEMMITLMGGLAQEESVSISQNMRWANRKRMADGSYKISCPPYGFSICNGRLEINETEAKIVRNIFTWYLSGYGITKIANILNDLKIPSSISKSAWSFFSVKYILTNERYIGDAVFQKTYKTTTLPYMKKINHGEYEKYYVSGINDAIVDKLDFEKVQELLAIRGQKAQSTCCEHPLSRKLICGFCGATFKRKRCREKYYWVCRTHNENAEKCGGQRLPESKIYEMFMRVYNKLKSQYSVIFPPIISQLQELKNRKFSGNQQYMEIAKEIAKLKEQNHVLARLKTKGFLDEAKYLEQIAELNSKINKLSREQHKIVRSDDEDDMIDQIKDIASIIENGMELMTEFNEIMFESLVEKIIVINQNELEFHLYGGLKFTERLV